MIIRVSKKIWFTSSFVSFLGGLFFLTFKDLAGNVVYFGTGLSWFFSIASILVYTQNKFEIDGKMIIHHLGKKKIIVNDLQEIKYTLVYRSVGSSGGAKSLFCDLEFLGLNGEKIEASYFGFKRATIREFVSLALEMNPDCKVTMTSKARGILDSDVHKYL